MLLPFHVGIVGALAFEDLVGIGQRRVHRLRMVEQERIVGDLVNHVGLALRTEILCALEPIETHRARLEARLSRHFRAAARHGAERLDRLLVEPLRPHPREVAGRHGLDPAGKLRLHLWRHVAPDRLFGPARALLLAFAGPGHVLPCRQVRLAEVCDRTADALLVGEIIIRRRRFVAEGARQGVVIFRILEIERADLGGRIGAVGVGDAITGLQIPRELPQPAVRSRHRVRVAAAFNLERARRVARRQVGPAPHETVGHVLAVVLRFLRFQGGFDRRPRARVDLGVLRSEERCGAPQTALRAIRYQCPDDLAHPFAAIALGGDVAVKTGMLCGFPGLGSGLFEEGDDGRVGLDRSTLRQAECVDGRLSAIGVGGFLGAVLVPRGFLVAGMTGRRAISESAIARVLLSTIWATSGLPACPSVSFLRLSMPFWKSGRKSCAALPRLAYICSFRSAAPLAKYAFSSLPWLLASWCATSCATSKPSVSACSTPWPSVCRPRPTAAPNMSGVALMVSRARPPACGITSGKGS